LLLFALLLFALLLFALLLFALLLFALLLFALLLFALLLFALLLFALLFALLALLFALLALRLLAVRFGLLRLNPFRGAVERQLQHGRARIVAAPSVRSRQSRKFLFAVAVHELCCLGRVTDYFDERLGGHDPRSLLCCRHSVSLSV
jgi:hypothetical protein